ncbi:MAG: hypothetical protein WD317_04375 [Balneolaceae bacterium]
MTKRGELRLIDRITGIPGIIRYFTVRRMAVLVLFSVLAAAAEVTALLFLLPLADLLDVFSAPPLPLSVTDRVPGLTDLTGSATGVFFMIFLMMLLHGLLKWSAARRVDYLAAKVPRELKDRLFRKYEKVTYGSGTGGNQPLSRHLEEGRLQKARPGSRMRGGTGVRFINILHTETDKAARGLVPLMRLLTAVPGAAVYLSAAFILVLQGSLAVLASGMAFLFLLYTLKIILFYFMPQPGTSGDFRGLFSLRAAGSGNPGSAFSVTVLSALQIFNGRIQESFRIPLTVLILVSAVMADLPGDPAAAGTVLAGVLIFARGLNQLEGIGKNLTEAAEGVGALQAIATELDMSDDRPDRNRPDLTVTEDRNPPAVQPQNAGQGGQGAVGDTAREAVPAPGKLRVIYRLSPEGASAGRKKSKLPHASKKHCLQNCIDVFGKENITVVGDRLGEEMEEFVIPRVKTYFSVNCGNGRDTFFHALGYGLDTFESDDVLYLLEDDFLHKAGSGQILREGLGISSYASLYDHPDKYLNRESGGNPFTEWGGEITRLLKTESTHWKLTNSTVMSFAVHVNTIREDEDIFREINTAKVTDSFRTFLRLREKNRTLVTPVPGWSTHTELRWLSPFEEWEKI